ncbi:MAG TPA: alkaline phosphatase family protein [Candidatus Cybelea sp.]|nr:alkaline phosphatase family protein [Candidatus Cybelea sp.]
MARNGFGVALVGLLFVAACSANGESPIATNRAADVSAISNVSPASSSIGQYISHVVVIIQENRSFENFFAGYPKANAPLSGCSLPSGGAAVQRRIVPRVSRKTGSGCPPGDVTVPLKQVTFDGPDLQHNWVSSGVEYDKGNMDGFGREGKKGANGAYSFVKRSLIEPYWSMANQYVLADKMFPTEWGGSFTGHLTLIAGNDRIRAIPDQSEVDFPNGLYDDCDSPAGTRSSFIQPKGGPRYYQGPFPCFDQFNTIADVLDRAGISWKIYATKIVGAGMWQPFEAIKSVRYGPDWRTNVVAPQTTILSDPGAGRLADVTWVTPSKKDSDHPGNGSDTGPSWVASIVNAIGLSPYWNTSAIIVVWDDWGGWYDNVKPPQLDYRGLGFRVPCLIISPYAKTGFVDDTQYEYASILKFIEEVYNLPNIGPASEMYTDARAKGLDKAFDFTQQPRPFVTIDAKYPRAHFLAEPPSNEPVDTE